MNYLKTIILLAAMTALFVGIGFMLGGPTGMLIAFAIALAMNAFAYWNSDRMVLSMYGAKEVDAHTAPDLYHMVEQLARGADLPMPKSMSSKLTSLTPLLPGAIRKTRRWR